MDTSVEGIIVNNCQYTPVYLIQDPRATQASTYVLTPSSVEQSKPISNNLKTFYENSGNIENGLVNVDGAARPLAANKKDSVLIGNNLKLASFLLPKHDNINKQYIVDNIVIKSNVNTTSSNSLPVNIVPKIDVDRKIVKLKEIPILNRPRADKALPKIKPKENPPSPNISKHTSVQLIKLGETYHSLNHLDKEQLKIVNQALKMFKDPDKTTAAARPTYDPVTNTQYIYKVVSPKDLTVVGRKKVLIKDKKLTKVPRKVVEDKLVKHVMPAKELVEETPLPEPTVETKVTRSGRKVKLPKQMLPEDSPHKHKKKTGTIVSCFQCSAEFGSLYRLQKHYERQPSHVPARVHANLFHCLAAIVGGGSAGERANMLVQQLAQLVAKLRALRPCLLRAGEPCTLDADVGRIFGMKPGRYHFDVDALNCVKDKDGFCVHNPPKLNQHSSDTPSSQSKPSEEIADSDSENCARINSVAKWPTVSKRIWRLKQKTHELSAKKMRMKSEDTLIDLGTEELVFNVQENSPNAAVSAAGDDVTKLLEQHTRDCDMPAPVPLEPHNMKNNYVQFHSAHFDIRSSPIKSSSTVFRKFQINPSKLSEHQAQVIRPLELLDKDHNKHTIQNSESRSLPLSAACEGSSRVSPPDTSASYRAAVSSSGNILNDNETPLPSPHDCLNAALANSNAGLRAPLALPADNIMRDKLENDLHVSLANSAHGPPVAIANIQNVLRVPLSSADHGLDITLPSTDNSLHDIFKSDVDLACKEDSNIDSDLKEWIISTSEKSRDALPSFTKSNGLSDQEFLHISDSVDKSVSNNIGMCSLQATDNRILSNQGESVLNFLENLGNELAYPETEIRNNSVDFHLDLFTFHNSV